MNSYSIKYDKIGIDYNDTRMADVLLANRLYELLEPTYHGLYLDIGCGTGNYSISLADQGLQMIGIDPSVKMLDIAKAKAPQIDWKIGSAAETGLERGTLDGITAFLTIHHWSSLEEAFTEMNRLLKPSGSMVIFTSTPSQMKGYWLNHYFPQMMKRSIDQMPALSAIESAIKKIELRIETTEKYYIRPDHQDLFLYAGKHRPALYLDPQVRKGISSFADLALQHEIDDGLNKLKKDIDTGKINEIIDDYENDLGDYIFVKLLKD